MEVNTCCSSLFLHLSVFLLTCRQILGHFFFVSFSRVLSNSPFSCLTSRGQMKSWKLLRLIATSCYLRERHARNYQLYFLRCRDLVILLFRWIEGSKCGMPPHSWVCQCVECQVLSGMCYRYFGMSVFTVMDEERKKGEVFLSPTFHILRSICANVKHDEKMVT